MYWSSISEFHVALRTSSGISCFILLIAYACFCFDTVELILEHGIKHESKESTYDITLIFHKIPSKIWNIGCCFL